VNSIFCYFCTDITEYDAPQQLVEEIFERMDTSGNGKISLSEYQAGALKNPDIKNGLNHYTSKKV